MTVSSLGRKLRELRKEKGLTLDELAQQTGSSKSYVWELENKPVSRPSGEKIARFAQVLGVTPEYLVDEARTQATASDRDKAFFRRYEAADPKVKAKLNRIMDLLEEE